MSTNLRRLCASAGFALDGERLEVLVGSDRRHVVALTETEQTIEVRAIVARAAAVAELSDLALRIWRHNRLTQLVSFRIDERGRVGAMGWLPKAGITADELRFVVQRVAVESDRLEWLLTGRDVE